MCVHDLKGVACLQVLAVSGFPCLFWFLCNHHYDASHTFKAGISCSSGMCVSRVNQTGPPSAVVSASDCGLEGGVRIPSESCGIFRPWPAPTQSWECYGPNGKAGTTQPSFIHFTDASEGVALII